MTDKEKKICPVHSIETHNYEPCIEHRCAWWVNGYTTEGISVRCCAIEFIAMKNSDGQYRV